RACCSHVVGILEGSTSLESGICQEWHCEHLFSRTWAKCWANCNAGGNSVPASEASLDLPGIILAGGCFVVGMALSSSPRTVLSSCLLASPCGTIASGWPGTLSG